MSGSVNRSGESGIASALPGSRKSAEAVPMRDDVVLPQSVEGEFVNVDLRYVVWTITEVAHLLDPVERQAQTYCGLYPKAGGRNQLKSVLFIDSPGKRKTCERCFRVHAARSDTKKSGPGGSIHTE